MSKVMMNTTLTNTTSPPVPDKHHSPQIDDRARLVLVVLGVSIVIMGVLGNSFILVCVLIFRRLHLAHYLFLCSLVAADLILSGYVVLFFVIHLALSDDWMVKGLSCKLNGIFLIAAGWSVVLSLFVLTLNRYLYLCKRTWFDFLFGKEVCIIITLSIWVGGLVGTLPTLLDHTFHLDPVLHICTYNRKESYYISAIGLVLLIVICGSIFCIVYEIYRTARALELRNEAVMSLRDLDREEGERDRDFRLRPTYKRKGTIDVPLESPISKRELRFAWGLVVINLCRLLLSLPFLVVSLVDRTIKGSPVVHQVAFFLMMLNSCMNWVILLVFDLALKRSLKKAMCGQGMHGDQSRNKKGLSSDTSSGSRWPKIKKDRSLSRDQRSRGYDEEEESEEATASRRRRLKSCWYGDEPSLGGSETEEEQRKRPERADWKRHAFWNLKRPEPPQPQEVVEEKHEDEYAGQSFLSRQLNLWLSGNDCQDATVEPDTDHEQGTGSRHSGSRKSSPVRFQKRSTSSVGSNDEGDQPRVRDATRRKSKMADMVIQVDKNGEKVRLQDMVQVWLDTLRRSQGGPSLEEREEREEEVRRRGSSRTSAMTVSSGLFAAR
ncbi:alpha-1A adrenergic receptor-like [Pomacea canaliculata]|uniref:alpha-1A adrenergic receptor-like n=1 Tax=Pomacea canaliculata TaxID=400727 RepID=UPI000D729E73|nr:alpha-1A adrenergic receptor-like [Pomacea canaliculata]